MRRKMFTFRFLRPGHLLCDFRVFARGLADDLGKKKGIVLGAYNGAIPGEAKLTLTGNKFDLEVNGRLKALLKKGSGPGLGKARVFNNLGGDYWAVCVSGLGEEGAGYNQVENINELKENVRIAAAVGARTLQDMGCQEIKVETLGCGEAAAEGSALAVWRFQEYRSRDNQATESQVDLYDEVEREDWDRGIHKADAQNTARMLEDTPANLMTPAIFAEKAIDLLCPRGVKVEVRDREWLEHKKMTAFLSVARGSMEAPLLLEMFFTNTSAESKPVTLVGKGITFDTGGLCLKERHNMEEYRADMAGGAVIVGALQALSTLNIPINVNSLIPLCENMPAGMAVKPGDVVMGVASKTIRVDDTAREGRVVLADALAYTDNYKPCLIINIATLTGGMRVALGASSTGVFSSSDSVWKELNRAGAETGDRVWRFPLWKYFSLKVTDFSDADVHNIGLGRGGDPCLGAAFLLEFVPRVDFVHMDITGTGMMSTGVGYPYLRRGAMTGRPTRTLVQFLEQMTNPLDKF